MARDRCDERALRLRVGQVLRVSNAVRRGLAVAPGRRQVVEDPGRADDGRLLGMGQRHLDDLDAEQRRIGVLVGHPARAPRQLV